MAKKLTEHKLNLMKILYYDMNGVAIASEVGKQFKKIYQRDIGNVHMDLYDLCSMGLVEKDEQNKTYSVTAKGQSILSMKCGDPPKLELVYCGILIEKIPLYEELYQAIQKQCQAENQPIKDWVIEVLELAAGIEKKRAEEIEQKEAEEVPGNS